MTLADVLTRIAAMGPWEFVGLCDDSVCFFCGADAPARGEDAMTPRQHLHVHQPDCLWRQAVEAEQQI